MLDRESSSQLIPMHTVLVINNNPDNQPGKYTQLFLTHLTQLGVQWVEARNVEQVGAVARDSSIEIGLIVSCGSAVVLTTPVDLELHVTKTSAAMLRWPEVPVVGVCYGMQLIAQLYGGLLSTDGPETGHNPAHWHQLTRCDGDSWFDGLEGSTYWCTNFIFVTELPHNFHPTLVDEQGRIMAMEHLQEHVYGVQFHPETIDEQHPEAWALMEKIVALVGQHRRRSLN